MNPFQTAVSAVRERKKFTSQREAEEIVRAVLEAVREPSDEMAEAGASGITASVGDDTDNFDRLYDAPFVWRSMIDSLLGSGG